MPLPKCYRWTRSAIIHQQTATIHLPKICYQPLSTCPNRSFQRNSPLSATGSCSTTTSSGLSIIRYPAIFRYLPIFTLGALLHEFLFPLQSYHPKSWHKLALILRSVSLLQELSPHKMGLKLILL